MSTGEQGAEARPGVRDGSTGPGRIDPKTPDPLRFELITVAKREFTARLNEIIDRSAKLLPDPAAEEFRARLVDITSQCLDQINPKDFRSAAMANDAIHSFELAAAVLAYEITIPRWLM